MVPAVKPAPSGGPAARAECRKVPPMTLIGQVSGVLDDFVNFLPVPLSHCIAVGAGNSGLLPIRGADGMRDQRSGRRGIIAAIAVTRRPSPAGWSRRLPDAPQDPGHCRSVRP